MSLDRITYRVPLRVLLVTSALVVAGALAFQGAPAAAPPGPSKVAVVDIQKILTESKLGQQAKQGLDAAKASKQKQIDADKERLKKAVADLNKQKSVLKPDAVATKEKQLQEEYVNLQQKFMNLQQDLAKDEAKVTSDVVGTAQFIIRKIAERDGYTLVVEKSSLLWSDPNVDITAEVNKRLDAGERAK